MSQKAALPVLRVKGEVGEEEEGGGGGGRGEGRGVGRAGLGRVGRVSPQAKE